MDTIKIMLVDDHALVRNGIKSLLEDEDDLEVVDEANDGKEIIKKIKQNPPDLLIADIKMDGFSGIDTVRELVKLNLPTRFLMLSMHDSEEYVLQSLDAGAHGYLLKDASRDEFLKAIKTVYGNGLYFSGDISKYLINRYQQKTPKITPSNTENTNPPISLTKRELQILKLAATGMSNQEIADQLGKSKRTIEAHRFNLMKKMEVKNLMELTNKGRKMGFL